MNTIRQHWLLTLYLAISLGRLAISAPSLGSETGDVIREGLATNTERFPDDRKDMPHQIWDHPKSTKSTFPLPVNEKPRGQGFSCERPIDDQNNAETSEADANIPAHSQGHLIRSSEVETYAADSPDATNVKQYDARQLYHQKFIEKYGQNPWQVPKGEEWYWIQTKAPSDSSSIFKTVLFDPFMQFTGLHTPRDPTYGRHALPFSPKENLIRENKRYTCWDSRVFLEKESKAVDHETGEWVWYQVWWDEEAAKRTGVKVDILWCHGISEYGGIFAPQAQRFLEAGYRLILPDLPAHGRSTGVHAYIPNFDVMAHAIHAVLVQLTRLDAAKNRSQRAVVVAGQSMGGFAAVLYGLLYHSPTIKKPAFAGVEPQPIVLGLFLLCPMLAISPTSRPSYAIELLARGLALFAGRFPITKGQKGKGTHDPWCVQKFGSDPQGYHGELRSATGLAILDGLEYTDQNMSELILPFRVVHGEWDRVTTPAASQRLYEVSKSQNKQIRLYPNMEHLMLRVGRDAEDDQPRQEVLNDMLHWINQIQNK